MTTSFSAADLPNRFDFSSAQDRIYGTWENGGHFRSEPQDGKEPYTIVIPPPNVTGALHLGHALNNSLQDIMIRFKRMMGFNALWMPGTDHAGIATQAVVERRLKEEEGKTRHDLGREKLVERIWQWKDQYETRILGQLKQMGCSCDWSRTRFTLDDTCGAAVRATFFDLFNKQLIYRGKRLVNWDTHLRTAVSDDEVFKQTIRGNFWHFRYPVIDPQPGEPEFVTIATTRPETMLGDTAVAVHPNPKAALEKIEREIEEKLAKASSKERGPLEAQLANVQERRATMLGQLERLRDMALDGRKVLLPLMDRPIPLVADEWAKPEMGSGCVKITPAHDPNDYDVASRCELPLINILNADGTLNENAGNYQGQGIKQARKAVIRDLEAQDLVEQIEEREIELPHSDRSKTPIEPYLADQWFVKMDQLAQSAMDAVTDKRVQIFPDRYVKGYLDWLGEKRDWPVSRQLWWGHQIPVWSLTCQEEADLKREQNELDKATVDLNSPVAVQIEYTAEENRRARIQSQEKLPHAVIHVCTASDSDPLATLLNERGYVREEDVLDTWFSSALWPHSTLGWPQENDDLKYYYPTSSLITSRDIITLWVARMVLTGLNNMGDVPFREVFIHPKILDGQGETMSKSKGNGVDPIDVIDKCGADALRYALAYLTTQTQDVRMPVQFECPSCETLIEQTPKNRELHRIDCPKCSQPFRTQWANKEEDLRLPKGAVVSERFGLARNFCNKLWNASRLVLINLADYDAKIEVHDEDLTVEDRWILSRLSTVTETVTTALETYRFAEAARSLYGFTWDEFCDYYLEMIKGRMEGPGRATTQRILAFVLDQLLRLLHPMIPFITEEIWGLLNQAAPQRGITGMLPGSECLIAAEWPEIRAENQDTTIEEQFEQFKAVLKSVNGIRARQNVPHKRPIEFSCRCSAECAALLEPMQPYFTAMANATATGWGDAVEPPQAHAADNLPGMDVFVDLKGLIDEDAEREKNEKAEQKLVGVITGLNKKLANASFVERAPADVVEKTRQNLAQAEEQLVAIRQALGQ